MTAADGSYRYLNGDGRWPGFTWDGLALDAEGVLRLMPLPRFDGVLPARVRSLDPAPLVAGLAIDRDGTIYFSDPAANTVRRVNGCSAAIEAVPCLGRRGAATTPFSGPAALLIPAHRHALYVADAGNGRIQIFDLETMALIEVLSGFQQPVSLASSEDGRLYVVAMQARRLDQLTISGDVVSSFWDALHADGRVTEPVAVACDGPHVVVLDGQSHLVHVFDQGGTWVRSTDVAIAGASMIAAGDDVVYVGDPGRQRVAVFRLTHQGTYTLAGDAVGYDGPVAALACDRSGGLLVLPGGGFAPLRLTIDGSYRHEGWLHSGAIAFDDLPHFWNRLHADIDLPEGSHVQFFVAAGVAATPPASPTAFPLPAPWRAIDSDSTDFFLTLDGAKTPALWIAARFDNDAHATPALAQLRVDFDQSSYVPHLPAVFGEHDSEQLLLRYLSLYESFFRELEDEIDRLPALVDPAAARPDALAWLAGFLALPLPETWSEAERRQAIAGAYERYARRGTIAGLLETLRLEAGVRATIDEPIQAAGWWSMPGSSTSCQPGAAGTWVDASDSLLGVNTILVSAEPQGAVVGTTATLDRSQLLTHEEYGMPLFDEVAHRFTLRLYPRDVECAGKLDEIKAIVDREKPAHTAYEVCVFEPGIRIGYQARLGIDTLLGRGPVQGRLGDAALVLAGSPPSRLGLRSHLGVSTHL